MEAVAKKLKRMMMEPWRIWKYLYLELLRICAPGKRIRKRIKGSSVSLCINPGDYGISRDLFYYGTREENAARLFLQYIKPGQTIIDLGANIGYYVCLQAEKLAGQGHLFAIEPDERNIKLLQQNVNLNGFESIVSVNHCAVGNESGEAILHVAAKSNLNTLRKSAYVESLNRYVDERPVTLYTLDDFIAEQGIAYEDVNVVRMDIEGYEYEVLQGMTKLLAQSKNLLLFMEIHGEIICDQHGLENYVTFIQCLEDAGFELCHAVVNLSSYKDKELDLKSIQELKEYHECIAVILRTCNREEK